MKRHEKFWSILHLVVWVVGNYLYFSTHVWGGDAPILMPHTMLMAALNGLTVMVVLTFYVPLFNKWIDDL